MTNRQRQRTLTDRESVLLRQGLQRLNLKTYRDYLRSPHWRRFRKEHCKKACEYCGAKTKLCLHHRTYVRLGRELVGDVVTLCDTCHRGEHGLPPRRRRTRRRRNA